MSEPSAADELLRYVDEILCALEVTPLKPKVSDSISCQWIRWNLFEMDC